MMVQSNVGLPNGGRLDVSQATALLDDTSTPVVSDEGHHLGVIQAMREQEEAHYQVENYFLRQDLACGGDAMDIEFSVDALREAIDPECRFRMSEWCYQIADFCGFKRETVAIAMSCLDRFIASKNFGDELYMNRTKFQLASMVCLYSSVKTHEHEAMDAELVATLSRGAFDAREIEEMEAQMLSSLQFRVNPPTALAFSKQLLDLIPSQIVDNQVRDALLELAKFQTEIAVSDPDLMPIRASTIALAALVNAFDGLGMDDNLQRYILQVLSEAIRVDSDSSLFRDVRIRLYEGLAGGGEGRFSSSISPQEPHPGGLSNKVQTTCYETPKTINEQF